MVAKVSEMYPNPESQDGSAFGDVLANVPATVFEFEKGTIIDLDDDKLFGVIELRSAVGDVRNAMFRKGTLNLDDIASRLRIGSVVSGSVEINGSNLAYVQSFKLPTG